MLISTQILAPALLALHLPIAAQVAPATPGVDAPEPPAVPTFEVDVAADELEHAILLLSGYHGIPTREELEGALEDARAAMLAIAQDPEVSRVHRDRALGALTYWPDDDVRALYTGLLAAPDTPELVRHRLIGHLAVGFGDEALETIAPYLDDEDVQFRLSAVHALGEIGTPAAMQRLDEAARIEQSTVVLEQIQQVGAVR